MNHAQKYLAQANRQIAELTVQIAAQRVIVKQASSAILRGDLGAVSRQFRLAPAAAAGPTLTALVRAAAPAG